MSKEIAVIGLGYVGLPLAISAAECGYIVNGIDTDLLLIKNLIKNEVQEKLPENLQHTLKSQKINLTFHNNYKHVEKCEIIVVCLPTPLDIHGIPDLSILKSGIDEVSKKINPNSLLIIESTVYPGATNEIIDECFRNRPKPRLGYSPERIDPSSKDFHLKNTPKIIAADDEHTLEEVRSFYSLFIDNLYAVDKIKTAEFAKIIENTYRLVNISLVNELLMIGRMLDLNTRAAIDAAASKPFGFQRFNPGIGAGGHCIPVDPAYLLHKIELSSLPAPKIISEALEINRKMPNYVFALINKILNEKKANILIYGVTYKSGVSDTRESPAYYLRKLLVEFGHLVSWYDPVVKTWLSENRKDYFDDLDLVVVLHFSDSKILERIVHNTSVKVLDCTGKLEIDSNVELL